MASQVDGGISWTNPPGFLGETWNVGYGCSRVSPGCAHCWAESMAAMVERTQRTPLPHAVNTWGWTGRFVRRPEWIWKPLHWKRPRCVAVQLLGDLFHESVPFSYIAAVYGVIARSSQHRFIVLTKRPERRLEFYRWLEAQKPAGNQLLECNAQLLQHEVEHGPEDQPIHSRIDVADPDGPWPPANLIDGVSAEDQKTLCERVNVLLETPSSCRVVSLEPLVGPVQFGHWDIDWLIVGGESGNKARSCSVKWIRNAVRWAQAGKTAVHVKQLGRAPAIGDSFVHFNDREGRDPAEWPADLRVQEYPEVLLG